MDQGEPAGASTDPALPVHQIGGRTAAPERSIYDEVGGAETFRRLVERFYAGVAGDPVLRAVYPEEDLGPAAERLTWFLIQYWGGPAVYTERRGHPRLRMRHEPFAIGERERTAWLTLMESALDSLELAPEPAARIRGYLRTAARTLQNRP